MIQIVTLRDDYQYQIAHFFYHQPDMWRNNFMVLNIFC